MKATIRSTDKFFVLGGLNFRVWEGVTESGIKFISLINRSQAVDAAQQVRFVDELGKDPKKPDPATDAALVTMGVVPPPPSGQV